MKRTKIQNDTLFMVEDEIYSDSILPNLKKELKRDVAIYGKSIIDGGIYAKEIKIDAKFAYIKGSVCAQDSLYINAKKGSDIWFNSIVTAFHTILVDKLSEGRIRFGNSINSQSINLNNCIVYGNIFCDDLIIQNSVVLGGVFCKKSIKISNSIVGTYDTPKITSNDNIGLIFPYGISDRQPEFNGKIFNIFIKDYKKTDDKGIFQIGSDEVFPVWEDGQKKYVLSSLLRIFDFSEYYDNVLKNLQKLVFITTKNIEEVEVDHQSFKEFDNSFFKYIESMFEIRPSLPFSKFMELTDEVISNSDRPIESRDSDEVLSAKKPYELKQEEENQKIEINESDKTNLSVPTQFNLSNDNKNGKNEDTEDISEDLTNKYEFDHIESVEIKENSSNIRQCPECSTIIDISEVMFCNNCGYNFANDSKCAQCGSIRTDHDMKFCDKCGYRYDQVNIIICMKCKSENDINNSFCSFCGESLKLNK